MRRERPRSRHSGSVGLHTYRITVIEDSPQIVPRTRRLASGHRDRAGFEVAHHGPEEADQLAGDGDSRDP